MSTLIDDPSLRDQFITIDDDIDTPSTPLISQTSSTLPSLGSRLFPEIISLIVELSMDDYFQLKTFKRWDSRGVVEHHNASTMCRHALGGPWIFTQINKLWRAAVIGDQSLWMRVAIFHYRTERMVNPTGLLDLMLCRSGSMPLYIKFSTGLGSRNAVTPTDVALLEILGTRSPRWKALDIATNSEMVDTLNTVVGKVNALESLSMHIKGRSGMPITDFSDIIAFSVVPNLRHLAFPGTNSRDFPGAVIPLGGITRYYADMLELADHFTNLRSLSNLVHCSLSRPGRYNLAAVAHLEPIHMAHLTSLKVANATFLAIILAPGLKHLDVSACIDMGTTDSDGLMPVASFIRRSSQALESVRLNWGHEFGASLKTIRQLTTVKLIHLDGMAYGAMPLLKELMTSIILNRGYEPGASTPTVPQPTTAKPVHVDAIIFGLGMLLLMLHCDSQKRPSSLHTLLVDIKELEISRYNDLKDILTTSKISLNEPTLTHTLLKITFYTPPEDGTVRAETLLRGEGKLVPPGEAYPLDLSPNTEWPMIGNGFWRRDV